MYLIIFLVLISAIFLKMLPEKIASKNDEHTWGTYERQEAEWRISATDKKLQEDIEDEIHESIGTHDFHMKIAKACPALFPPLTDSQSTKVDYLKRILMAEHGKIPQSDSYSGISVSFYKGISLHREKRDWRIGCVKFLRWWNDTLRENGLAEELFYLPNSSEKQERSVFTLDEVVFLDTSGGIFQFRPQISPTDRNLESLRVIDSTRRAIQKYRESERDYSGTSASQIDISDHAQSGIYSRSVWSYDFKLTVWKEKVIDRELEKTVEKEMRESGDTSEFRDKIMMLCPEMPQNIRDREKEYFYRRILMAHHGKIPESDAGKFGIRSIYLFSSGPFREYLNFFLWWSDTLRSHGAEADLYGYDIPIDNFTKKSNKSAIPHQITYYALDTLCTKNFPVGSFKFEPQIYPCIWEERAIFL